MQVIVGRVAKRGTPVNTADAPSERGFRYMPETGEEIYSSFLGVPIQRVGERLGVLVVQSKQARQFSDDELYALEVVAMVLAEMTELGAFVGDGETDEPESLGAISLAGREKLNNLIFVINCNLQRLDGPVRGNGKIIQELEGVFRGAGWNVIKVIWGREWDELLSVFGPTCHPERRGLRGRGVEGSPTGRRRADPRRLALARTRAANGGRPRAPHRAPPLPPLGGGLTWTRTASPTAISA